MHEAIFNRRSIRRYKPDPVTEEQIHTLLHAAMMAPSAKNGQPWHFVVCDKREIIDAIMKTHPFATMLKEAPVCIVVCGEQDPELPNYYQQDCAAATENLMLAAYEMGLGTCWMGVAPREERMEPIAKLLNLPDGVLPFNLIAVGHPNEKKEIPERYKEEKVHFNKW